ncbi:interferon a3-like isoform X2 [Oreochromis niloticus]|uniref:interferon a3-like isoform X2 n=1 Tax=Oreochromis niloticus TaxID=8128 RepID=UPI000DF45AD5|nr:interferon a3-like isoform X2 [Oreochromis niloticus]
MGAGSSLSCRWMDHKFRQHNEETLNLLDTMAKNVTNTTEVEVTVAFPNHLYRQVSKSSAEDKLVFTVQVLEEVAVLFEEDHSSASWEHSTVRNFLNIVNKQAEELHSCIGSHGHKKKTTKLHMYFKRLSHHILKEMGHSAEAWEVIRKETKAHLMRAEQLASSLHTAH